MNGIVGWAGPCGQGCDVCVGQGGVLTCRQGGDPWARQGWVGPADVARTHEEGRAGCQLGSFDQGWF